MTFFTLFDSAGVGLLGLNEKNAILHVNDSFLRYLDLESNGVVGREVSVLESVIPTPEFWEHLPKEKPFYCMIPGRNFLLLTIFQGYSDSSRKELTGTIQIRPYSLEREFIRMRSRLNQNIALEIGSHLSSVSIAAEIITQPEVQEDGATKDRFLSTFFHDITDLGGLISAMQEIAEPIPFPNRIRQTPLDWRALVTDLLSKMRGLASEKNVSLASEYPSQVPSPSGDYHWLYLALYGVLHFAVNESSPLDEVQVTVRGTDGGLETAVRFTPPEGTASLSWPPPILFPMAEDNPRIGKMGFSELSLSRSICLLHRGDLERTEEGGAVTLRLILSA